MMQNRFLSGGAQTAPAPVKNQTGSVNVRQFSIDDVCQFVMALGLDPRPFHENAVEGEDLLELNDKEFEEYLGLKPLQVRKLRKKLNEIAGPQEVEEAADDGGQEEVPQIFQKFQRAVNTTSAGNSFSSGQAGGFGGDSGGFSGGNQGGPSKFSSVDHREGNFETQDRPPVDYSSMKPCERGLAEGVYARDDEEVAAPNAEFEKNMFSGPSTGIDFEKYASIPAEVTGNNVPKPIESFEKANLHPLLLENIRRAKYKSPTPVQKYGLPVVLSGRDLMGCAQTGSGKTAAFLFPIISQLLTRGRTQADVINQELGGLRKRVFPDCTIVCPTRELALQIFDECRKFAYRSYIHPCVVYGGADPKGQVAQLKNGCHLLIATPGRLTQMIERGHISLSKSLYFVMDEADRMLDMGFEPQIRKIATETDLPEKGKRQTLMFSATFPRQIQLLASEFLVDYIFLTVGRVGAASGTIKQIVEYVEEEQKHDNLIKQLKTYPQGLTLVFVQTKKEVDTLEEYLKRLGLPATSLSGDRSQFEREDALQSFINGITPVLVATDVAQRGLDIPNVQHVINFDMPASIDDYVHRIGRTGRAGNHGRATSFFNDQDTSLAADLVQVLQETNQEPPAWLVACANEASGGRQRYKTNRDARGSGPPPRRGGDGDDFQSGGFSGGSSFDSSAPASSSAGDLW